MSPEELIRRWENLCIKEPGVQTGTLLIKLFDDWRKEIDQILLLYAECKAVEPDTEEKVE